ncbi:MAG: protein kinase [Phormidesmis sp. RL_2_1]|nr:protein kinase [Phormidesmis sp. RL_2_1]
MGQGGFGRTFLAQRLTAHADQTPLTCVIKQTYGHALTQPAEFVADSARLRQLGEHPQIPSLLEALETEYGQFLVQAFIPGDNLETQIETAGPWPETQVRSLLKSLVPVLQYVHSFDIIHRDIKPANIILKGYALDGQMPDGPGPDDQTLKNSNLDLAKNVPVLVDFGSAKWVRQAPAKTVIGSADYASPEQSIGQATFASDIYSLGLSCLHLLTAIDPFSLYSMAEDRWVWQDYLPQPIQPRFAQLLDQMVARSLQQRYESMDQVALDLQFSQNPLLYAPKQLLTKAKESIPALKNALPANTLPTKPIVVSAAQIWHRRDRITRPIGITQAIAISPRAPIFATGSTHGTVRLWHLPSRQLIHTFHRRRLIGDGHTGAITALRFHPDGRALYSASADGLIKEWDSAERCLLNTLPTAGWTPMDLTITADGTTLISPNSDGKIVLWDIATLRPIGELVQHQQRVNAVALSAEGDVLASASDDGTVKLWRFGLQSGQQHRASAKMPTTHQRLPQLSKTMNLDEKRGGHRGIAQPLYVALNSPVASNSPVALSSHVASNSTDDLAQSGRTDERHAHESQEQQMIVADTAGKVHIYTLDPQLNPHRAVLLYTSPQPITSLALNAHGCLAVGTEDSVLTLWQITTGECVAKLAHDWGVVAIAFSADGKTLITTSADEVISIWQAANT